MREVVKAEEGEVYDIELEADILKANDRLAEENKELLRKHRVVTIDVMGAIGSGKTSLIEKMVQVLKEKYRMAAFKGDLTTTIDAELIGRHGVEVVTISTGKECHLDANLVRKALQRIDLEKTDILFIENVGNLVCPAEFKVGEDYKVAMLSVTEGDEKPLKYPLIFAESALLLINKIDLLKYTNFNLKEAKANARRVNPDLDIIDISCTTGEGIEDWIAWLNQRYKKKFGTKARA